MKTFSLVLWVVSEGVRSKVRLKAFLTIFL